MANNTNMSDGGNQTGLQYKFDAEATSNKHQANIIQFNSLDFSEFKSYVTKAKEAYSALIGYKTQLQNSADPSMSGKSAMEINDLLAIIPKYIGDYHETILEYDQLLNRIEIFINDVDSNQMRKRINDYDSK